MLFSGLEDGFAPNREIFSMRLWNNGSWMRRSFPPDIEIDLSPPAAEGFLFSRVISACGRMPVLGANQPRKRDQFLGAVALIIIRVCFRAVGILK
jgi:hypothetical protein